MHYDTVHLKIREILPQPLLCELCDSEPSRELHNIDSSYDLNPEKWLWVCRGCHLLWHGRKPTNEQKKAHSLFMKGRVHRHTEETKKMKKIISQNYIRNPDNGRFVGGTL